jgi:hypothetical protein
MYSQRWKSFAKKKHQVRACFGHIGSNGAFLAYKVHSSSAMPPKAGVGTESTMGNPMVWRCVLLPPVQSSGMLVSFLGIADCCALRQAASWCLAHISKESILTTVSEAQYVSLEEVLMSGWSWNVAELLLELLVEEDKQGGKSDAQSLLDVNRFFALCFCDQDSLIKIEVNGYPDQGMVLRDNAPPVWYTTRRAQAHLRFIKWHEWHPRWYRCVSQIIEDICGREIHWRADQWPEDMFYLGDPDAWMTRLFEPAADCLLLKKPDLWRANMEIHMWDRVSDHSDI